MPGALYSSLAEKQSTSYALIRSDRNWQAARRHTLTDHCSKSDSSLRISPFTSSATLVVFVYLLLQPVLLSFRRFSLVSSP